MLKKIFDKLVMKPIIESNIRHKELVAKVALNYAEQVTEFCKKEHIGVIRIEKKES